MFNFFFFLQILLCHIKHISQDKASTEECCAVVVIIHHQKKEDAYEGGKKKVLTRQVTNSGTLRLDLKENKHFHWGREKSVYIHNNVEIHMIFACPLMAEWRKERFHIRFGTLEKGKKEYKLRNKNKSTSICGSRG